MSSPRLSCCQLLFLAALLLAAVLVAFPRLDLAFSALFYDPATEDFWLGDVLYPVHQAVQLAWKHLPRVVLVLLVASLLPGLRRCLPPTRLLAYFALTIALVPMWLVNDGLKEPFGRARPAHVTWFGGEQQFTPAAVPADQCHGNCSFVSGDAAGGFTFIALALAARRRRRLWCLSAVALGGAIGLVRIAEGRHFLSDVVFAGLVTTAGAWLLYQLLMTERGLRLWRGLRLRLGGRPAPAARGRPAARAQRSRLSASSGGT